MMKVNMSKPEFKELLKSMSRPEIACHIKNYSG